MGCGETLTSVVEGAWPVIAPGLSTGKTSWFMNTFQAWPLWLEGSTFMFEPYQTACARPGPPALIQGKTLTASPLPVEPSETWTGFVQVRQPEAAEDALTNTWSWEGVPVLTAQATTRLRALSIEATLNRVSGEPGRLSAMWISPASLGPPPEVAVGASRKLRLPAASGLPMLSSRS